MSDGANQCQAAIAALSSIQQDLRHVYALRQRYGPDLFNSPGGPWTGKDAYDFTKTLGSLLAQEQHLTGQAQDLIDQLQSLKVQLQNLGV